MGILLCMILLIALAGPAGAASYRQRPDGIELDTPDGALRLTVYGPSIIRVTSAPGAKVPDISSLAVIAKSEKSGWKVSETNGKITLQAAGVRAEVDKKTGAISFHTGNKLLCRESAGGRSFTPATINDEKTLSVGQHFTVDDNEAFYGLGHDQSGSVNRAGRLIPIKQGNTDKTIPVLVSSRGYGILWDNPSYGKADLTQVNSGPGKPVDISLYAEVAKGIDYYFLAGPTADEVIAGYRHLTGDAPLYGKWVYGYWQCKEHYASAAELIEAAEGFRSRGIPIDNIIQDWQYWTPSPWGSHDFDPKRYPDPAGLVKTLHEKYNLHVMISVWPKFMKGGSNYDEMDKKGFLFPECVWFGGQMQRYYDPFNPEARKLFWKFVNKKLFSLGIDGWWLDGDEPEVTLPVPEVNGIDYGHPSVFHGFATAMGSGAGVLNAYPLVHTQTFYEGQRSVTDKKRVFLLSRCSYSGMQRNAATCWSGDIPRDWDSLRRQIPAGLDFVMSGVPYWNTDIGGFWGGVDNGNPESPAYQELFTRWIQYGAFCPMMRVHGENPNKEPWRFGAQTEKAITHYINLRYRLLPYIYSVAWMITKDHYTLMRPLVMDFPGDVATKNIGDQFMFGPALMVNPVTERGATSRDVYLPTGASWVDFWTGKPLIGGRTVSAEAPLDVVPILVRAGSIIPMGPFVQYSNEKPADPIEIRVYPGADGRFTLYEDEGDTYNYEKGKCATIQLEWNDKSHTLTIGNRKGGFDGMLKSRTFKVVVVKPGRGTGIDEASVSDKVVKYDGKGVRIRCS